MKNRNCIVFNPLMSGGNKRPYIIKQTCDQPDVCLSTYDLLLPPNIKGLNKMLNKQSALSHFRLTKK